MSVNKNQVHKSITSRGNFSIVPNEIWTKSISLKSKAVYIYLLGQSEKWNSGVREIAAALSISIPTARDALKELELNSYITIELSAQGLRNVYSFNDPSDWSDKGAVTHAPKKTEQQELDDMLAMAMLETEDTGMDL